MGWPYEYPLLDEFRKSGRVVCGSCNLLLLMTTTMTTRLWSVWHLMAKRSDGDSVKGHLLELYVSFGGYKAYIWKYCGWVTLFHGFIDFMYSFITTAALIDIY